MSYFLRFLFLTVYLFHTSISFGSGSKVDFNDGENEVSENANRLADPITGAISGSTSVCLNTPKPVVTFTGKGGTSPYTFNYTINGGPEITVKTVSGKDTVTVRTPTDVAGIFKYTLLKIFDASNTRRDTVLDATIAVNALPDANFEIEKNEQCAGTPIKFTPVVSGDYSYKWDFGDSVFSTEAIPKHSYKAVGTGSQDFKVKLIVINKTTSCKDSVTKVVKVKQVPDASLDIFGK